MTKVTRERLSELERRRLTQESCHAIGVDLGITATRVRQLTQHLGVRAKTQQPRHPLPRRFDYATAVALSVDLPVRVVAAQLGAKKHTVWRALRVMRRGYP